MSDSESSEEEEEQRHMAWRGIDSQNSRLGLSGADFSAKGTGAIPTQADMDALLMEQKKKALLQKMQFL